MLSGLRVVCARQARTCVEGGSQALTQPQAVGCALFACKSYGAGTLEGLVPSASGPVVCAGLSVLGLPGPRPCPSQLAEPYLW